MKTLKCVLPLMTFGLLTSPVLAADEAVIENLQTDVSVTKSKTDENAQHISNLKAGLPAIRSQVDELEAALVSAVREIGELQTQVNALETALDNERSARLAKDVFLETRIENLDSAVTAIGPHTSRPTAADIEALGFVAGPHFNGNHDALTNIRADQHHTAATNLLDDYVTVVTGGLNGLRGPHIIFEGANVHIRNGDGSTYVASGTGNLIVGYNEHLPNLPEEDPDYVLSRIGSHNLVVGPHHRYRYIGSLVAGIQSSGQAHGVPGISELEIVEQVFEVPNQITASRSVSCPSNKKALAGGYSEMWGPGPSDGIPPSAKESFYSKSAPLHDGTGWQVDFRRNPNVSFDPFPPIRVVAICAEVSY